MLKDVHHSAVHNKENRKQSRCLPMGDWEDELWSIYPKEDYDVNEWVDFNNTLLS